MKQLLFTCSFFILHLGASAQFDKASLQTFIEQTCDSFELPSLSLAVIKDGEVLIESYYGNTTENENGKPVDQNTLYGIASLSKAFTAASIGMLVDEGKLDWDDKVTDHLPWFKMYDDYVTEHMTISDLLSHRSGLITFDGDLLWYGTDYDRNEIVKRIQFREPSYEFRAKYGYQNIMFITAGQVIEKVSGMSWDDFVKTRILDPLGMSHTTSSFADFKASTNRAEPHIDSKEIPKLSYDNSGATAALNSCVSDMSKWAGFWLGEGIIGEDTLLSKTSIKKLWTLHTPQPTSGFNERNGTHFKGYGHGWFLMDYKGKKVAHHGGGLPGYITKLALLPEEDIAIIALTNEMSNVPEMMMYMLTDWVMEDASFEEWPSFFLKYKRRSALLDQQAKQERMATKNSKADIKKAGAYLGMYQDKMFGNAEVIKTKEGLALKLKPSEKIFSGKLTPWDDNAFRWDHKDPFLTYGIVQFELKNGKANGFTIELPNYDFHFDKLDFKRVNE